MPPSRRGARPTSRRRRSTSRAVSKASRPRSSAARRGDELNDTTPFIADDSTRTATGNSLDGSRDSTGTSVPTRATTGIAPSDALPYFERAYRATGHPAFAWQALLLSLDAKLPIPNCVSTYFLSAASRMSALFHGVPPKKPATAVFRALGFPSTRSRNPLCAVDDDIHDSLVAFEVWSRQANGEKFDAAVTLTAEAHPRECVNDPKCESISARTVARYWKKYKSRFRGDR